MEFLRQLPKVDLHCHLDGSIRFNTILELAEKNKVKLPTDDIDKLRLMLVMGDNCKSLSDYLQAFEITLSVLQDEESLSRVAYELIEDCAKENIWYVEVRFSPILHTNKGLKITRIVEAVLQGLKEGEKKFPVKTGLIICAMRESAPEVSLQLAELCIAYKYRGVVGFDLAGTEEDFPAKDHQEAFYLILKNNVNCTIHAGEGFGPESIHQAIHYCGAHRIGHGTRLKEDADLLNYVNDHRIPLEICLSSNMHTKVIPHLRQHPLRTYHDLGLRVTINTDNRLMSNTDLTKEYYIAVKELGFTLSEIKDVIIFGFKSTFQHYREKVDLLNLALKRLTDFQEPIKEEKLSIKSIATNLTNKFLHILSMCKIFHFHIKATLRVRSLSI